MEAENRQARRGAVLVIDDEPMVGDAVRRALEAEHDVLALESAKEALQRLERGERYDVIICDMMMPVVDGAQFYEGVRRCAPEHLERVVFLSAGVFTPEAQAFLASIPNVRLGKPFDLQALRQLVRERLR